MAKVKSGKPNIFVTSDNTFQVNVGGSLISNKNVVNGLTVMVDIIVWVLSNENL